MEESGAGFVQIITDPTGPDSEHWSVINLPPGSGSGAIKMIYYRSDSIRQPDPVWFVINWPPVIRKSGIRIAAPWTRIRKKNIRIHNIVSEHHLLSGNVYVLVPLHPHILISIPFPPVVYQDYEIFTDPQHCFRASVTFRKYVLVPLRPHVEISKEGKKDSLFSQWQRYTNKNFTCSTTIHDYN